MINQKDELDIREGTMFNLKLSVLLAQRGNVFNSERKEIVLEREREKER